MAAEGGAAVGRFVSSTGRSELSHGIISSLEEPLANVMCQPQLAESSCERGRTYYLLDLLPLCQNLD